MSNFFPVTKLYRAVGVEEYFSIKRTGKFSLHNLGVDVKYFGLNFEETLKFADMLFNVEVVAIISVEIDAAKLQNLADFTHIDTYLFKSGTAIITAANLPCFNSAIKNIKHEL
ncbi:MAG: hypothetical protein FWG68_12825 [Defluviitaleaceae bacterium]|nr:hypothetical protein [Defluviitaleaceae bacterium]